MTSRNTQIINHALALFMEKGVLQTSIQDIIKRAGISKGTFYNYFSSKNECVSAVLKKVQHLTLTSRSELQIGKRSDDLDVLIEQLSVLSQSNQKFSLSAIFEEMIHSHDNEMKRFVIQYRMTDVEWLADRLVDVYGEQLRPHAFEAAIIFFGIQRHLTLAVKEINQSGPDLSQIVRSIFQYMAHIVDCLTHKNTAVLQTEKLYSMRKLLAREKVSREEVIEMLDALSGQLRLTRPQAELTAALRSELEQQPLRDSVVNALLKPYLEAFKGTAWHSKAKDIVVMIWRYTNQ